MCFASDMDGHGNYISKGCTSKENVTQPALLATEDPQIVCSIPGECHYWCNESMCNLWWPIDIKESKCNKTPRQKVN